MECVSPILTIATDLFDCTAKHCSHIRDVKTRVEVGKQEHMTTSREVGGWLQDVGKEESEVAAILREGDGALEKECLGRYSIAYRLPRDVVDELPLGRTVGLDSLYEKVCSCLAEDEVGIVGLCGIRGVGKTTLMKKINNGLLETSHDFDTVIWVSVSEIASARAAQEVIGNKLQIIDSMWQNRSQGEKL
ncbi:hypothetical protein AAG906_014759 [Vitis piasezkii]